MHCENFSSWAGSACCCWLPPNAVWAALRYARQYWPGPELPCPPLFVPLYPPRVAGSQVMSITLSAVTVGSAWLGSPWLRIQAAHSFNNWVGLAAVGVVVELPLPLP